MFYAFFALISAMCGLDYILRLKKSFSANTVFLLYLSMLLLVYLTLSPVFREPIMFKTIATGAGVLLVTWVLMFLSCQRTALFKKVEPAGHRWQESLIGLMFIILALFSFVTINQIHYKSILEFNNPTIKTKDAIYASFRVAVTELRNSRHDGASFEFLQQRLERYQNKIDDKTWRSEGFRNTREILTQAIALRVKNQNDRQLVTHKLDLLDAIAPAVDNFYLNDGPTEAHFGAALWDYGILALDPNNAFQFYLPDKYQLSAYLSTEEGGGLQGMFPLGKNSGLAGVVFYGVQGGYPSIDVNFYFKALYSPLRAKEGMIYDYNFKGLGINDIISIKNEKKLLNITGVDYLIFQNYIFNSLPSPAETWRSLLAMGFEPVSLPESSKIPVRYGEPYGMKALRNPQSYGRAYVARWVETIKPEESMFNRNILELPRHWPLSDELLAEFNNNIARIPDNIWQAAIIESSDSEDHSDSPRIYKSNNGVNIIKIIGSKAVFDVDCDDDNCWFVYNTAALRGWQAFSGSTQLAIHKANLGFIGVKLSKGKHFVWMEYRPDIRDLSFISMATAWIVVLSVLVFRFPNRRGKHIFQ